MLTGCQYIVNGAAMSGQHLADDPGDAPRPAASRLHVWRESHIPGAGYALGNQLVVRGVADRIVDYHHARPRAFTLGNIQQRIDRSGGSVDLNRRHSVI